MTMKSLIPAAALALLPMSAVQAAPAQSTPAQSIPVAAKASTAGQSLALSTSTDQYCVSKYLKFCMKRAGGWKSYRRCHRWAVNWCQGGVKG